MGRRLETSRCTRPAPSLGASLQEKGLVKTGASKVRWRNPSQVGLLGLSLGFGLLLHLRLSRLLRLGGVLSPGRGRRLLCCRALSDLHLTEHTLKGLTGAQPLIQRIRAVRLHQAHDGLARLGAVAQPVQRAGVVDLNGLRVRTRVVETNRLNIAPIAGGAAVRHHNTVARLILGPYTTQSNTYHCLELLLLYVSF